MTIKLLNIYGTPVLMSGLGSLVLNPREVNIIDPEYKKTLQNLLKLSASSPASLVYFIAGSLPGATFLPLRQLSLFAMISRLPGDPLHSLAYDMLTKGFIYSNSWFTQI